MPLTLEGLILFVTLKLNAMKNNHGRISRRAIYLVSFNISTKWDSAESLVNIKFNTYEKRNVISTPDIFNP